MGNSIKSQEINQELGIIKNKIYTIQQHSQRLNEAYSAISLRNTYLGKDKPVKMLLDIFKAHNLEVESLVGKDYAAGTVERYKTCLKHLTGYVRNEYGKNDIPIRAVDNKFITGLEYYLKTTHGNSHNTAIKYIANFKKIIRIAYANDWISKDPFLHWKAKLKVVPREFLTKEEIQKIIKKEFTIGRLDQVKDTFIFCCFTGLSYADVKKLSTSDIVFGIDGERWIKTRRTKTNTQTNIPILPIAEAILKKYKDSSKLLNDERLLPVLSNQKTNSYLKEIADCCGINKNLTFHLARHTFATTVTLSNGVPIESVSKMLGHKSLKTTQHYAKILDRKVSNDMMVLKNILDYST